MVKATETNLEGLLEGKKQYQVPLYQRVYSWSTKQIDQLWSDLIEIADRRKIDPSATHFIGSLVLAASPDNSAVGVQKFLVVDGQQRLTTLTILLAALRDHQVEVDGSEHRDRIDSQYLINKYEPGAPAKVLPTQADRTAYLAVVRTGPQAGGEDAVGTTYRIFRGKIATMDDPEDPHDVAAIENAALRGLAVVAVTAEPRDNAHRIFESLNNTGLKLTQADLLKNYLFMRLGDRAAQVYDAIWLPLEQLLDASSLELLFWLDLVRTDEHLAQADTYVGQQVRLDRMTAVEIEAEIRRMANLAKHLATILDPDREADPAVRRRLQRIRAWGSTTSYPVLLQLLEQREAGRATSAQVSSALLHLESYFVRRMIIGRATAGLNRALLPAAAVVAESADCAQALRTHLSSGRKYFGSDAQVRDAVRTVAFYWQGRAKQRALILRWLEESYGSKEKVDADGLTVEHVLPQTLGGQARAEFAERVPSGVDVMQEHGRIVHTLGNLTLTGYNSELSNRPYTSKRTMLAKSGLRMNQEIVTNDHWGVDEITERGDALAERIIALWPGPDENVVEPRREAVPDLRRALAAIVATVPAGRWTSSSEVALVASSQRVLVEAALGSVPIVNAWRVLEAGGTIPAENTWADVGRTADQREVLIAEGLIFDTSGRADQGQFVSATELAQLAGLETSPQGVRPGTLQSQRIHFWEHVRALGPQLARHVSTWRVPQPDYWYRVGSCLPGSTVAMLILIGPGSNRRVGVELYIHQDKSLFRRLIEQRDQIDHQLGFVPEWDEMPDRKASRVDVYRSGDFREEAQRDELARWLIQRADDFTRVFSGLGGAGADEAPASILR